MIFVAYALALITVWFNIDSTCGFTEMKLESVSQMNESSKFIDMILKLKRISRDQYTVSGTVDLMDDIKNDYMVEVTAFHSALNNNQFTQLPFKLKETTFCEGMNTHYRKYLMKEIEPVSDLPFSEEKDGDLCAMFTPKKYTVTNFIFEKSKIPKFASDGLYKILITFRQNEQVVNKIIALATLS